MSTRDKTITNNVLLRVNFMILVQECCVSAVMCLVTDVNRRRLVVSRCPHDLTTGAKLTRDDTRSHVCFHTVLFFSVGITMTIIIDWCPTCEASCQDHPSMCSTCGSQLQSRPETSRPTPIRNPAVPDHMVDELRAASANLSDLLSGLRAQVSSLRERAMNIQELQEQQAAWQNLPPEAMNPQLAASRSRPTAKATLDSLPRIVVESKTSLLHSASIRLRAEGGAKLEIDAVVGEFGPPPPHSLNEKKLVVAHPKTGKGGLSDVAKKSIVSGSSVLYLERGDGLTFVKKAMLGQAEGVDAIIIGNNNPTWPYVMKDSRGEAETLGLEIPGVMVKQADGRDLVNFACANKHVQCDLEIQSNAKECIICVEPLRVGETVLRIPACGHVFHETCALTWLRQHNACPYCRRELPTDDETYEQERRRTQRTHAGSERPSTSRDELYG